MTTRAATFSAKIRNLTDFYQRILTNQQPPSGLDIVNTLRYFQQTLLGLLKDVQNAPAEAFISIKAEQQRSTLFPNLNYSGLYHAVNNIIDVYPQITTGQIALGSAILNTLQCLYLFLEKDLVEQFPYNVACLFSTFPQELQADVLRLLCNILLPFTLQNAEEPTYATASTATVIMMTFQFCQDPRHHTWLLETLMSFKTDVYKDVLSVIACGTSESRIPSANLLFYYWPFLNPGVLDRKTVQYKTHAWSPTRCQHKNCSSGEHNLSIKKCYNPFVCAEYADSAPPIYLCSDCSKSVVEDSKKSIFRFCQPMSTMVNVCQNRNCNSSNRLAICTCFSDECVRVTGYVPLRLCQDCHAEKHKDVKHKCHSRLPSPWQCDRQTFGNMITAIVSLLKETSYMMEEMDTEKRPKWLQQLEGSKLQGMEMVDERRMLSRYGIWMLVGLCTPTSDTPLEPIGHLMAMLFQWFGTTALLPSDNTGVALEQLKNDFVCEWLRKVTRTHYEVFIQCLTPKPPDFAKVGGHWDKLSRRLDQLKEGLGKILALIPYDLISFETWDKIMPLWLDALSTEVPEKDLPELKVVVCKIFETDMCSLPFPTDQMYHFIGSRLRSSDYVQQQHATGWLQLLTDMDITLPLDTLLNFYSLLAKHLGTLHRHEMPLRPRRVPKDSIGDHEGLQVDEEFRPTSPLSHEECPAHRQTVFDSDDESNASLFIVLLDILQRQFELNDVTLNAGTSSHLVQNLLLSLNDLIRAPWCGQHICDDPQYDDFVDCLYCRDTTIFYELLMDVVQKLCPKDSVKIEMPQEEDYDWEEAVKKEAAIAESLEQQSSEIEPTTATSTAGGDLSALHKTTDGREGTPSKKLSEREAIPKVMMATLEEEAMAVEFVGMLPSEELETAVAQAITLTEPEVGLATCKVITTTLVDETQGSPKASLVPEVHFWHTSQGKFRFTLEELPAQLQMIYSLMTTVEKHPDPDVIYFILHSMKFLCLHAEALINAHKEHRGFLIWAQESILISKFWQLLQAQYSQVSQMCVPLILHCLTLPSGADVFWKAVNEDFTSNDWKVRFAAVEKVTCISRFLDPSPVRGNCILQGALANAFSFLIAAAQDPNAAVAQRAIMYIETIKPTSLKCLCSCLEAQFDLVIADRPLIIHRLMLLSNMLSDQPILSWEFFLQRFDALSMEAQIQLEKNGEIAFPQDLLHSDPMSDLYQRKVTRARQALEQSDNVRSIVKNLDKALNYQKSLSINAQSKLAKVLSERRESNAGLTGTFSSTHKSAASSAAQKMIAGAAGTRLEPASLALGKLREFTDKESNFCMLLNKALDLENTERHTMHLMLTIFMKFLANPKTAFINPDEKAAAKKQSIVLRHLNILLGYSAAEKCFTIPPFRLRASAICNAFIASLPQVLDSNLTLGVQILPLATMVLQYLPSPQRYASDYQPPNYTLWYLEPHTRHCWLWSLLLILYKYHFNQPPINENVLVLIQIVVNTLNAHIHHCQQVEIDYRTPLFRSRGLSATGTELIPTSSASEQTPTDEGGDSVAGQTIAGVSEHGPRTGAAHHHPGTSATERYHRRKAFTTQARKQPTFDEREEQFLEEAESLEQAGDMGGTDAVKFETADSFLVDSEGVEVAGLDDFAEYGAHPDDQNGVDTRILEQIEEFDRSFASRESSLQPDMMERLEETEEPDSAESFAHATVVQPTMMTTESMLQPQSARIVDPQYTVIDGPQPQQEKASTSSAADQQQILGHHVATVKPTHHVVVGQPLESFAEIHTRPGLSRAGSLTSRKSVNPEDERKFSRPEKSMSEMFSSAGTSRTGTDKVHLADAQVHVKSVQLYSIGEEGGGRGGGGSSSDVISKQQQMGKQKLEPKLSFTDQQLTTVRTSTGTGTGSTSADAADQSRDSLSTSKHSTKSSKKDKEKYEVPPICIGSLRYAETTVVLRCTQCNAPYEMYDEDTLALAVVCLSTAIHREPAMTAPHLLRILTAVCKIANHVYHPWQAESSIFVPGNCRSVARQLIRVVLHQLGPNKLFTQLFQSDINEPEIFKTINSALTDFTELNPVMVIYNLLKDITVNWPSHIHHVIANLADYIAHIAVDSFLQTWGSIIGLLDAFLRRYLLEVADVTADTPHFFVILNHVLHVQSFHTFKAGLILLDCMSKLLSKIIQAQTVKLIDLLNLCSSCNRAFLKERDKEGLARCCVNELVQAIKFKTSLPEDNYMTIVKLILEDIGETVDNTIDKATYNTAVADVAKTYLQDFIEFIADLHVLHRMKNAVRGSGLKEDTLGGEVKAGLSRYVAYEIYRANSRDPRSIIRYVPWLLTAPSATLQGPGEFVDCVGHVRQLSWVLLGALYCNGTASCVPIPIETSHHISDHIQFVLAGFAEQSKESVLHMSALFHAFHLCQLWTVYCEEIATRHADSEMAIQASFNVTDFWARITPAILQLLSHSKVLADMVNLHFLNTVEALTECDSAIINKLFPMWHPILSAYHTSVPSHLVVRLDGCENALPRSEKRQLEPWLKRVCFKISQVELQSSAATQFYTV